MSNGNKNFRTRSLNAEVRILEEEREVCKKEETQLGWLSQLNHFHISF